MLRSLVGSEMCIRDRSSPKGSPIKFNSSRSSPKGSPIDLSIRVDRSIPKGSHRRRPPLAGRRDAARLPTGRRAAGRLPIGRCAAARPQRVEVGSCMRQLFCAPSLFDGVLGVVGSHTPIHCDGGGTDLCSCLGVNRINFHMIFDGFYILFRSINRKT